MTGKGLVRKDIIISAVLIVVAIVAISSIMLVTPSNNDYNGPSPAVTEISEAETVTIDSLLSFQYFTELVNSGNHDVNAELVVDLDISSLSSTFVPIGNTDGNFYSGTFDGKNHSITGLTNNYYDPKNPHYFGLFGTTKNATIKNLTLDNITVHPHTDCIAAGGLIGHCIDSITLSCCNILNNKIAGYYTIGGFIGIAETETELTKSQINIQQCNMLNNSTCRLEITDDLGNSRAGGVIGHARSFGTLTINGCNISCEIINSSGTLKNERYAAGLACVNGLYTYDSNYQCLSIHDNTVSNIISCDIEKDFYKGNVAKLIVNSSHYTIFGTISVKNNLGSTSISTNLVTYKGFVYPEVNLNEKLIDKGGSYTYLEYTECGPNGEGMDPFYHTALMTYAKYSDGTLNPLGRIQDMIKSADNGGYIEIIEDASGEGQITIDRNLTIDLGGKTVSFQNNGLLITQSSQVIITSGSLVFMNTDLEIQKNCECYLIDVTADTVDPNLYAIMAEGGSHLTVTNSDECIIGRFKADKNDLTIYSGRFRTDPKEYVVKDTEITFNKDGTYSVFYLNPEAKIGDVTYPTLSDAVEAADDGQTVEIIRNISLVRTIFLTKSITIDGKEHHVTTGNDFSDECLILIRDDVSPTIENITWYDINRTDIIILAMNDMSGKYNIYKNTVKSCFVRSFLAADAPKGKTILNIGYSDCVNSIFGESAVKVMNIKHNDDIELYVNKCLFDNNSFGISGITVESYQTDASYTHISETVFNNNLVVVSETGELSGAIVLYSPANIISCIFANNRSNHSDISGSCLTLSENTNKSQLLNSIFVCNTKDTDLRRSVITYATLDSIGNFWSYGIENNGFATALGSGIVVDHMYAYDFTIDAENRKYCTVVNPEFCTIGSKNYASIHQAILEVNSEETITLNSNYTGNTIYFPEGLSNINIDLNGKDVSVTHTGLNPQCDVSAGIVNRTSSLSVQNPGMIECIPESDCILLTDNDLQISDAILIGDDIGHCVIVTGGKIAISRVKMDANGSPALLVNGSSKKIDLFLDTCIIKGDMYLQSTEETHYGVYFDKCQTTGTLYVDKTGRCMEVTKDAAGEIDLTPGFYWVDDITLKYLPKTVNVPKTHYFDYSAKIKYAHTEPGYTLTGTTSAIDAGEYSCEATLDPGYIWSDDTEDVKAFKWYIMPLKLVIDNTGEGTKTYDGDNFYSGFLVTNICPEDSGKLTVIGRYNSSNVSEATTITFKLYNQAAPNYIEPDEIPGCIKKKNMMPDDIHWTINEITYTGNDQRELIGCYYRDPELVFRIDLELTFEGKTGTAAEKTVFVYAGDYTVTAHNANTNYHLGECTETATIDPIGTPMKITAGSDSKVYDGTALTKDTYGIDESVLVEGDELFVTVSGSITDYGTADNTVSEYRILRSSVDVSGCYSGIATVKGTLNIEKRPVTILSDSAEKTYDGSELIAENATVSEETPFVPGQYVSYIFSGTITDVGSTDNTYICEFNEFTKADNYSITTLYGTLTITNADIFDIVVTPYNEKYDGNEHPVVSYSAKSVNDQEITFEISKDTGKTWTGITNVKNVQDNCSFLYRMTAPNHNSSEGTFTVAMDTRLIVLTSASYTREYNGQPLQIESVVISGDGFINGEGYVIDTRMPSITFAGSVNNSFTYRLTDGTDKYNYNIRPVYGKLTIDPISTPITITAYDSEKKYDGTPLTAPYYSYTQGVILVNDILNVSVSGTGTNAGTYTNTVDAYRVLNNGVDITYCYTFEEPVFGKLTVTKRAIEIRSGSTSLVYTGEPLSNKDITVTGDGFVNDEGMYYSNFKNVIDVGQYPNSFEYSFNVHTLESNYDITEVVFGVLTITEASLFDIEITGYIGTYDGKEHVAAEYKAESVNDMPIQWEFSSDDGETWTGIFNVKDTLNTRFLYRVGAPNHLTENGQFTVSVYKRTLVICADNISVVYGSPVPKFSIDSGTGWIDGESYSTYGLTPSSIAENLYTTYTAESPVDTYDIKWKDGYKLEIDSQLCNYSTVLNNAQMSAVKASIFDIVIEAYNGIYDGNEHAVVNSVSAHTVNDQELTVQYSDDGGFTWSEMLYIKDAVNERPYLYIMSAPNHKESQGAFLVSVEKRTICLSWQAPEYLTYDKTEKIPSVTATGLCNDDQCGVTSDISSPNTNINVGIFTFTALSLDNDNYRLPVNTESPVYTIVPKEIEAGWDAPEDLAYSGGPKTPYAEVINLCNDDVCILTYVLNSGNNVNIGTFDFRITGLSNPNYCMSSSIISPEYEITKRVAVLDWSAQGELTYDGNEKILSVSVSNICGKDICEVTIAPSPGADIRNAGTFTYYATGLNNENYMLPTECTSPEFTIGRASVNVCPDSGFTKVYLEADPVFTYTYSTAVSGETPAFTGTLDRLPGSDVGSYMINKGTLKLIDNGSFISDNYDLYVPYIVYFTITPKTITPSDFTIDTNAEIYTGKPITKNIGSALIKGVDYTVSYDNNTDVGTATVIIKGVSNYEGEVRSYFTIYILAVEVPQSVSYVETGSKIQFEIPQSQYYTETSGKAHEGTEPGTYEYRLTLNENCVWADPKYDGKYFVYITETNKSHTDDKGRVDVIVTSKDGIRNDLEILSIATDDTRSVEKILSLADGTPKYKYDIKLLLEGKETEPETALTVMVLIPSNIINTDFSVYHIHDNNAKKMNYSVSGNYAVVTMEEFSDVVFVVKESGNEAPLPVWLFAIILIVLVAGTVGGILYYQKKKAA